MQQIAWSNGQRIPLAAAAVPVWDLGVVAGASVTEMARTFGHQPFRLDSHLERWQSALAALQFPQAFDTATVAQAVTEVVRHNAAMIAPESDLGIVVFSTAGANPTYLQGRTGAPTTVVHTFELPFESWRNSFLSGAVLRIPEVRQIPDDCFPVRYKVRNRLHWWLADQAAAREEPGSRALLLDHRGFLTETSTAACYLVIDGTIVTPRSGVLDSLSRRIVRELSGHLGIPFEERDVHPDEVREASESFLSSTPVCLLPVRRIDGRVVGSDDFPGPVFQSLLAGWSRLTGVDLAGQITGKSGGHEARTGHAT